MEKIRGEIRKYFSEKKKLFLALERGHEFYDEKKYNSAIKHYKEALSYIELPAKMNLAGFDSEYFFSLETVQSIWGWLALAYIEMSAEKEATKCIERERYFAQLAQTYLKSHQTRKKELYKEILVIMVIELFLFIAGAITYISLSAHPELVNFLYFLIYFTVFLIFLVNIRYDYKRHIKNKSFLTIKGLSQYAKSSQSGAAELFADPVFINIISLGFWMVILGVAILWEFINILSGHSVAGWEWIPSFLNGFIFHPVYIALTFFGLFLDRFIQSVREEVVQTNK